jgi:hypothetical protein
MVDRKFDLLGATCHYDESRNYMKISMELYIEKLLNRFDMGQKELKTLETPHFEESQLWEESKPSTFKYRAAVGGLQWVCQVCRPDIAVVCNKLARACARPVTRAMEVCCRKVFRYLAHTKSRGIEYSQEIERNFYSKLQEVAKLPDNAEADPKLFEAPIISFGDASFGSAYRTMRSISGTVIYFHAVPVLWVSRPQSLTTVSTMEAEYVAASSTIEMSSGPFEITRFLLGIDKDDNSNTNTTPNNNNSNDNNSEFLPNGFDPLQGPIFSDNRSCILAGRRDTMELQRSSRHISLKYARVHEHRRRLCFVDTKRMRADGVTKSNNLDALNMLFPSADEEISDYYFVDHVDAYVIFLLRNKNTGK